MNNVKELKINFKKLTLFKLSIAIFAVFASPVFADVLPMPVVKNVNESANTPRQGIDMQRVEEKYGAPLEKVAAVGEPPITRWVYPTFTVFFEHDKVLHSVLHRS
ncbi:MAG: DUF4179 domain-containing protein [Kangiellaceae bacterium]